MIPPNYYDVINANINMHYGYPIKDSINGDELSSNGLENAEPKPSLEDTELKKKKASIHEDVKYASVTPEYQGQK